MRRATKLLRLRNQIIDLTFLEDKDLADEVDQAFLRGSAGIPHRVHTAGFHDEKHPLMSRITRALRGNRDGGTTSQN